MNECNRDGKHANESLRFVQLSDLHLSSIGIPNPLCLLNKRILGYLSWLRKRRHTHQRWVLDLAIDKLKELSIDHCTITGDLTHIGLKNEFEQVQSWLAKLGSPENVTLIPGNHDLYVNERWSKSFKLWEKYLYGDSSPNSSFEYTDNALTQLNQFYPIVRIRKHVAFIGLNSAFNAPWFRATGYIHDQEIERLKNILSSPELNDFCKVLLIHHPITLTHTPPRKRLINHEALKSLLYDYPVNLVLHGHGHHSCSEYIATKDTANIPVIGMSSSSSISQKPNYEAEFILFEISQEPEGWSIQKQSYTLDLHQRGFTANQQQCFFSTRNCT